MFNSELPSVIAATKTLHIFGADNIPFRITHVSGDSRLLVITGHNASGKSLLTKALSQIIRGKQEHAVFCISMRHRTSPGMGQMIYGLGEDCSSTGAISYGVVSRAFEQLSGADKTRKTIIFDEPDIGLSDAYAGALGEFIGASTKAIPVDSNCAGIVIITHRRSLVTRAIAALGTEPTFINCYRTDVPEDARHNSLQSWLSTTEHKTVEELAQLSNLQLTGQRAIWKLEDKVKQEREQQDTKEKRAKPSTRT